MKIYFSGGLHEKLLWEKVKNDRTIPVLESYVYMNEKTGERIRDVECFMLDSGAYTFMRQAKASLDDWDKYLRQYAEFVKRFQVDHFFELDIDPIIGYDRTKQMRYELEQIVGKPCIPVWHKTRGLEDYFEMCEQYDYVAIGGINDEIKKSQFKDLTFFIHQAHKRGTRIHGLGFTHPKLLKSLRWDSVDSTSFLNSTKYGHLYTFDGSSLRMFRTDARGQRAKEKELTAKASIEAWLLFSKYAEKSL